MPRALRWFCGGGAVSYEQGAPLFEAWVWSVIGCRQILASLKMSLVSNRAQEEEEEEEKEEEKKKKYQKKKKSGKKKKKKKKKKKREKKKKRKKKGSGAVSECDGYRQRDKDDHLSTETPE